MKVDSTGRAGPASLRKTGKAGRTGSGEFAKLLEDSAETESVAGAAPARGIDAVLAVQGVTDSTDDANKRARDHGEALLERLEDIRNGLLLGGIPKDRLQSLAETVRQQKDRFVDPKLQEVLEDIELRALVELAKYDRTI